MKTSKLKKLMLSKMTDKELSSIVILCNQSPQMISSVPIVLKEVCKRTDTKEKILLDLQNMVVDKFTKRFL